MTFITRHPNDYTYTGTSLKSPAKPEQPTEQQPTEQPKSSKTTK